MVFWLCCLISIFIIIITILVIKIHLLRKAADEISDAFSDRVTSDTNVLIDLSSRDRHMQGLADTINTELRKLQSDRQRYQQGDAELKNAVTNISHDLRTPLTAIWGYLDMLDKEKQSENTKRYVKIIRGRTEIMTQLTEELFRYSVFTSVSGGTPSEPVILNSVLEESISALYASLKESRITPSISMPDAKVRRMLNRNALSRIFENIISNAVKYSDGRITFANHAEKLNEIQVGRLFDRFYTVETAASCSTGLGLSIARALTEQMGGSITAEYKHGMILVHVHFP